MSEDGEKRINMLTTLLICNGRCTVYFRMNIKTDLKFISNDIEVRLERFKSVVQERQDSQFVLSDKNAFTDQKASTNVKTD